MNKIDDGGPAFPLSRESSISKNYEGMTLRDYFAAKSLQGWMASYGPDDKHPVSTGDAYYVAQRAYAMADAMLRVRGAQ